jgi:uncharacterized lipoprotein
MKQLVIPAAIALLLAACSSTPDADKAGGGAPVESRGPGVATVTTGGVDSQRLPPSSPTPTIFFPSAASISITTTSK